MRMLLLIATLVAACSKKSEVPSAGGSSGADIAGSASAADRLNGEARVRAVAAEVLGAWFRDNPAAAACPTASDLKAYMKRGYDKDPWGEPLRVVCDSTQPRRVHLGSLGPDRTPHTDDDIIATIVGPEPVDAATVDVTAGELFDEYVTNEIGADAKYLNKRLRVVGVVARIGKSNGRPVVDFFVLEAPKNELRAEFSTDAGLAALKPDQSIAALCRGGNVDHRPTLSECTFESVVSDDE